MTFNRMREAKSAAGRTRNRLMDGLSAPRHYAAAFSSPSRTFAGHVFVPHRRSEIRNVKTLFAFHQAIEPSELTS